MAELLPQLGNDITVQLICTKLPWRTFHVLSSVSRAWLEAIRSGEINDTRIRSRSAETLAFLGCSFSAPPALQDATALYSLRDKAFYLLPPLAPFERGRFPIYSKSITMGGKVYILKPYFEKKVWVLDLGRQKKWQECARMQIQRREFGCAVFEGKIYVFGGYDEHEQPVNCSEVYDPKVDAWTKISPMKSGRMMYSGMHSATVVRDDVLVDAGYVYDPDYYRGPKTHWRPVERSRDGIEAYNPAKDSWRTLLPGDFGTHGVQEVGSEERDKLFTAHGRLHSLSRGKISVIDLDKMSVNGLHTCSFKTRSDNRYHLGSFWPHQVLATNDGLLTKGHFENIFPLNKCRLYQSGTVELGIDRKKIRLEEVECPPSVSLIHFSFLQPIEL